MIKCTYVYCGLGVCHTGFKPDMNGSGLMARGLAACATQLMLM